MWETIAIIALDIIAFFVAAAITYRWLFKRLFDILCSGISILVLAPLFLVLALRNKQAKKEGKTLLTKEKYVGKKGKIIYLRKYASKKKECLFSVYSLLDVFEGKLSFVGVAPFRPSDWEFLDEEELDRQYSKPGLINPLVISGDEELDYDGMLENDCDYALKISLWKDVKIFVSWILRKARGEGTFYLGTTREKTYALSLLEEERIEKSAYDEALKLDNEE
jgi:lipopolysaccharide/colanic/teichoic acid biosynthesis glycosyltransferase